jgi:hypothetical protein
MKAKVLLRIASGLMLFHTLGHSIGALTWKQAPNARLKMVIDGMLNDHFDFMGKSVTIGNFYAGYGYSMIALLLFITILLWLLSNELPFKIIFLLGLFLVVLGVLEFIFFFPLPAICSALAGLLTLTAYSKRSF